MRGVIMSLSISQLKQLYKKSLPKIQKELQNLEASSKVEKIIGIYDVISRSLFDKPVSELDVKRLIIVRFIVKVLFVRMPNIVTEIFAPDLSIKLSKAYVRAMVKLAEALVARIRDVDTKTKKLYIYLMRKFSNELFKFFIHVFFVFWSTELIGVSIRIHVKTISFFYGWI